MFTTKQLFTAKGAKTADDLEAARFEREAQAIAKRRFLGDWSERRVQDEAYRQLARSDPAFGDRYRGNVVPTAGDRLTYQQQLERALGEIGQAYRLDTSDYGERARAAELMAADPRYQHLVNGYHRDAGDERAPMGVGNVVPMVGAGGGGKWGGR